MTALIGGGMAVRAVIEGDGSVLFAWAVAVLFIPTLAMALGVLSGSRKLFEVIYVFIWYVGPINNLPVRENGPRHTP